MKNFNLNQQSETRPLKSFLIPNSSFLLRTISLALIFVLVAPMVYDAFQAAIVFAADSNEGNNEGNNENQQEEQQQEQQKEKKDEKKDEGPSGDLPLEKINRDHFFRLVEMCWPKYIQKLIRWLANWAIDKLIEVAIKATSIPVVSEIAAKFWDMLKVFRDKVDLPIYPRCNCKDDSNTQDSAWLPMNWMFAQHYIKDKIKDERMTKLLPQWEGKQHPMFISVDVGTVGTTYGWRGREKQFSHTRLANYTDDFKSNLKNYDSFIARGTGDFNTVYPNYNSVTSVIDEQDRIAERWRKAQLGYMKFVNSLANLTFHKDIVNWRNSAFTNIFTAVERDIDFDKVTVTEKDNKWWDPLEWFKEFDKIERTTETKKMSLAQTVALKRVTVSAKLLDEQIDSNFHTAFVLDELAMRAMQNKKSIRNEMHRNVDLMGHHASTTPKKTSSRKVKLGFN